MTKEKYLALMATIAAEQLLLNETKKKWRQDYIDACKPCTTDNEIELISSGGKSYIGKATAFGIFNDEVIVTAMIVKGKKIYMTHPAKSIKILG